MSKYICRGCACNCQAVTDDACDCKPTACLYQDIAKNYDPEWICMDKKSRIAELPTVEEIRQIIMDKELMPAICEDSGQAEWTVGESRKLAQALYDRITRTK